MEKINCRNCFNPTDAIKIKIINEYPHPPSLNSVEKKKKKNRVIQTPRKRSQSAKIRWDYWKINSHEAVLLRRTCRFQRMKSLISTNNACLQHERPAASWASWKDVLSEMRGFSPSLLCPFEASWGVLHPGLGPLHNELIELLEYVQKTDTNIARGMEQLSYWRNVEGMGLFILE